ncbi:hypothetical protein [Rhizobium lentis]|uniref:Uncharacterized protein n=1 Tax=Rhizobium lentis TaxID=1138194 RepID=A0A9Q3MEC4_9HYPH|nr:hypothetical protein [Rhizobium lentis]MBX5026790.1 hypothetical protein [Rhizobium lentis]MBX5068588.1 hypothetical protein [Rhizobium lentis]MBX5080615.1 hypothetical protein [Rhizobium lentis]QSW92177.1 hypothetical protein J0663_13755 [Rhizobium lentis]
MRNRFGVSFSEYFDIDPEWLKKKGVFDPTLDIDSPLFIDPFLLHYSSHPEFSDLAASEYEARFTQICALLLARGTPDQDAKAYYSAFQLFKTGEVKGLGGTCLGYGKSSTAGGRGIGKKLAEKALGWAKTVVNMGVKDPELFSTLSLFEEGIGADRISDMVASICANCIIAFNQRIIAEMQAEQNLSHEPQTTHIAGHKCDLLVNPFSSAPLLLLPTDILKHLPVMNDATSLQDAAETDNDVRQRVNAHIGEIFKIRTKAEKEAIKRRAMEDAQAFQALLDVLKILEKTPYDMAKDPQGLMQWKPNAATFSSLHKLEIKDDISLPELQRVEHIVQAIIGQFKKLIEQNRLSRTFYVDGNPRHERYAQLLFLAIAFAYCDANGLDMSPESDAGAGPVDFKFSSGKHKVIVEIKLSTNKKIVAGYKAQLQAYELAEGTNNSHYVVIDVGSMGNMWRNLLALAAGKPDVAKRRRVHLIDGKLTASASKLSSTKDAEED